MSNSLEAGLVVGQNSYLQGVSGIDVLTVEEERDLAVRYSEQGDLDAARQLILSNLRFVIHIARGYSGYGLPQADLIQEGNVGLMKAVKRFDPSMNVRLVSYAVHWIRAEIHEFILRNWRIVKVATTKAQRKLFFNLRSSKKRLGWFSHDEVNAVAKDLGVQAKDVLEMESRMSNYDASFDPAAEPEDGLSQAPVAYLADQSEHPAELHEQNDWQNHNENRLYHALETLDDRARDIVSRRWLAEKKTTLQELADQYQVSAERIRQLEKNAINKLKSCLAV